MRKNLLIERTINNCPEIDCTDYERYPLVTGRDWYWMERETLRISTRPCAFFFLRFDDEEPYIEVYVWEQKKQFEADYTRFIIREGMSLSEELEGKLLFYTQNPRLLVGCEEQMEAMYYFVREYFPQWHYFGYKPSHTRQALEHIYFASHPSGPREILYKAELENIAYGLDEFDSYNAIGTTPQEIIGHNIPKKLLRILNHSMFSNYYSDEKMLENCVKVYSFFSGYVNLSNPSYGQWHYLARLYANGLVKKEDFNRKFYDYLGSAKLCRAECRAIVARYFSLLKLRNELGISKHSRFPDPDKIEEEIVRLEESLNPSLRYQFENRASKEASEYEHFGKEYGVFFPKASEQIRVEAVSLKNCLTGYIRKHGSGDTTILFVREMDKPDKSFVAIEVCDKEIVQAYSACNQRPDEETMDFLFHYADAKGFKFDPEEACRLARGNN